MAEDDTAEILERRADRLERLKRACGPSVGDDPIRTEDGDVAICGRYVLAMSNGRYVLSVHHSLEDLQKTAADAFRTWVPLCYFDLDELAVHEDFDSRLPKRYDVAKVVTTVVFNTIPSSC